MFLDVNGVTFVDDQLVMKVSFAIRNSLFLFCLSYFYSQHMSLTAGDSGFINDVAFMQFHGHMAAVRGQTPNPSKPSTQYIFNKPQA